MKRDSLLPTFQEILSAKEGMGMMKNAVFKTLGTVDLDALQKTVGKGRIN